MTNQDNRPKNAADLRQKAEALPRERAARTPEDSAALSPEDIRKTLHELRVQQIELEMQKEELRAAQARIEAGRARYFDLYDLAPVGYCTLSEQGLILEANLAATTLLSTARGALIKQPISRFILKDDQDIYYLHRKKLFETHSTGSGQAGEPQECELRLAKPDGTLFWAHLTATAAQAEDGAPVCLCVISDITERKRAEEALRESKIFARSTLDGLSAHIAIVDESGVIVAVNKSWRDFADGNPPVLGNVCEGANYLDICDRAPSDAPEAAKFAEAIRAILNGSAEKFEMEYPCHSPDEQRLFIGRVTRFSDSTRPRVVVAHQDITARKLAEEALRASERQHRLLVQHLHAGVVVHAPDTHILLANEQASRLLGLSVDQMMGKTAIDPAWRFVREDETVMPLEEYPVQRVLFTRQPIRDVVIGVDRPATEDRVWVLVSAFPELDAHDRLRQAVVTFVDITERKEMENVTHARARLLQFATAHSLDMVMEETLNEVETLTGSLISFYHFVDQDQKSLWLQNWSTRTKKEFCKIGELSGFQYDIANAGVWVDCVNQRKPVIHNDYASLSHKKGLPEGHAPVVRELVVPLMRDDKVTAILGVGNKPSDYKERDIRIVSLFAGFAWDIAERIRAEKALRESDSKYREFLETLPDMIYEIRVFDPNVTSPEKERILRYVDKIKSASENTLDEIVKEVSGHLIPYIDGTIIYSNETASKKLGYSLDLLGDIKMTDIIAPEHLEAGIKNILKIFAQGNQQDIEYDLLDKDKKRTATSVNSNLSGTEFPFAVRGVARDITDLKLAEEEHEKSQSQLRQSQKMEAVGRLSAGIAHDFNNLLTTVIGNADLILSDLPRDDPLREEIEEIKAAGERAASLTRQLLAFSRKQIFQPEVENLNRIVSDFEKMLRRIMGEDIELWTDLAPDLGQVEVDAGQVEQVIMNLCVNARDAMPKGGKLTIETRNVELDEAYADAHIAVTPGPYVMLAVSDTGLGMTKEVQSRLFEPFFTTKEKGRGTGLGLATVYGIVKQSNGNIWVYSEPGKGATFKIYLPRCEETPMTREKVEGEEEMLQGTETVLVVEDDEMVRNMTLMALKRYGYHVLWAPDGREALRILREHKGMIHLMLTDVVMPGMSGADLGAQARKMREGLKILFMSGYTDDAIVHHGVLDKGILFLQKPFTPDRLAKKVREVLGY